MSAWLLLRGLTRETRHWGGFPGLLEASLPDAAVHALELPGNGTLNALPSPWSIEAMAAHCRREAFLRAEPPYSLLAMSMGAMVAAAWAQAHPEDVARCVLVSTSFGALSPPHRRLKPSAWPALAGILLAREDRTKERRVFDLTCERGDDRDRTVEAWSGLRRSHPVSGANALRQLLAAARFRAPRAAPVPTLVLAGARDRLVDPRCSEAIARRWGCPFALHPWAGHDVPLDDGAWVAQGVRRWLEGGT